MQAFAIAKLLGTSHKINKLVIILNYLSITIASLLDRLKMLTLIIAEFPMTWHLRPI